LSNVAVVRRKKLPKRKRPIQKLKKRRYLQKKAQVLDFKMKLVV